MAVYLTLEQDLAKAQAAGAKKSTTGLSGNKRSANSNSQIPAEIELSVTPYKECYTLPIRNSYKKDENGDFIIDEHGNKVPQTAEFVYCKNAEGKAWKLYPGTFSKMGREVQYKNDRWVEGDMITASGDVVDFMDQFASNEDAMQALVSATLPKGTENPNASDAVKAVVPAGLGYTFHFGYKSIKAVKFDSRDKALSEITTKDVQNMNIPVINFTKPAEA